MIPSFPEFTLNFNATTLLFYLTEVAVLSIILFLLCFFFKNNFFDPKYFSNLICPSCHGNMKKIYLSDTEDDENDYIIYKCRCGFYSHKLIYKMYTRVKMTQYRNRKIQRRIDENEYE